MRSAPTLPGACLLLLFLLPSCAYDEAVVETNGQEGALFLERARTYPGLCGVAPANDTCAHQSPCWTAHLEPGPHDLVVSRRVRLQSGNGLGDNSRCITHDPMGAEKPALEVRPATAATLGGITPCTEALRLTLTVQQAGDLELRVTLGRWSDRFKLTVVPACAAYTCPDAPTRPGPGSCD